MQSSHTATLEPITRTWVLYRFYDADGVLLYIGITGDLDIRFTQHSKDKPWWRSVATVRIEHHETPEDAAAAEKAAIQAENPVWNVVHTDKARARRPKMVPRVVNGETWVMIGEAHRLLAPLGISRSTVVNWADGNVLAARRLAGGKKQRGPRQIGLTSINEVLAQSVPRP